MDGLSRLCHTLREIGLLGAVHVDHSLDVSSWRGQNGTGNHVVLP
jgi:hypothetical protein